MHFAPTIDTARLRLRHHRIEDFDRLMALMATDWSVYMGGPYAAKETWWMTAAEAGSWSLLGHGSWAVDLRESGKTVGQVGVNKYHHYPEVELGWSVWPEHEGHGYAFEAAEAARAFAYDTLGLTTLVSYIDPKNARSITLAQRLGAQRDAGAAIPEGDTPDDTVVYRHPAPEALQ